MRKNKKALLLLILSALVWEIALAQEEFKPFEGRFEDLKTLAQKENKLILIDLYFEGCMPCKKMDQEVFPDAAVLAVLNPNYITYKTDVFKEEDGKKLSRKYTVSGFPTYILMDARGNTILLESGFLGVDRFIPLLKRGMELKQQGIYLAYDTNLDKDYPAFYSDRYFKTGHRISAEALNNFMDQQTDAFNELTYTIGSLGMSAKYNAWIFQHIPDLRDKYGDNSLRNAVTVTAQGKARKFGAAHQLDSLQHMLEYVKPVFTERLWTVYLPKWITEFYKADQDATRYLELIDNYNLYPNWEQRSNALGQVIIDQRNNRPMLQQLKEEYAQQQRKAAFHFTDTYKLAVLDIFLGNFEEAAIALATLEKMDLSTQYLKFEEADLQSMKDALTEKNSEALVAKDLQRPLPFSMD